MPQDAAARQHHHVTLAVLAIGGVAFALAQTTIVPALPDIQQRYGASASTTSWLMSAYFLVAAVATPILGRLGDMFGKQRLLAVSLAFFVAGSLLSAVAGSIEMTIAGRALQGVGGGVFPLSFGIVRDEFPRDKVPSGIGLLGSTVGLGAGLGLPLGGIITDGTTFSWIFWIAVVTGLVAMVAVLAFVPESPVKTPGRVDVLGALVLSVGLVVPLYGITKASTWGWGSPGVLGLLLAGAVVLAAFAALERRRAQPLIDMATFTRPVVLRTNITTFLVGFGLFGTFILIPQLAEAPKATGYGFAATATVAGLLMMPSGIMNLFIGPLSGAVGARHGARVPLIVGSAVAAVGLGGSALDHSSELSILVWMAFLGVGVGLAFSAMPNLVIESVAPHETGEATGVNTIMRNVGATVGSQLAASILAAHTVSATGLPSDGGYVLALLVGAGGCVAAAVFGLTIPARLRAPATVPALVREVA